MPLQGGAFPSAGVSAFARSFGPFFQLKLQRDAQNAQLEQQKERLKLEGSRIKGIEADRQLKSQELQLKLQEALISFRNQQQLGQAITGAPAPATSDVPSLQQQAGPQPGTSGLAQPPVALPGQPPSSLKAPQPASPQLAPQVTPQTGDGEFDVVAQRLEQLDNMRTRLLPLSASQAGNRVLDNVSAEIASLRQRQRDFIADERRPGERREKLRVSIRGENQVKLLQGAQQAFSVIAGGVEDDSNFGDLAMINGFARLLDPGSVVRPEEFATIEAARAMRDRIQGFASRIATGERLTRRERKALQDTAKRIMQRYIDIVQDEVVPIWQPIAQQEDLKIEDVIIVPEGFKFKPSAQSSERTQPQRPSQPSTFRPSLIPGSGETFRADQ
ncbi:MAG: hypothetical protein ACR2QC_11855 [Gammaproteobacteria bacterium]